MKVITLKYPARCCTCWKPIEAGKKAVYRPGRPPHQRFQHVKCSHYGKARLGIGPDGPNMAGQASTHLGRSNWKTSGAKMWRDEDAAPSEPKQIDVDSDMSDR